MSKSPKHSEESLDPQDWAEARALGHRMLDEVFNKLEGLRQQAVWQPLNEDLRNQFRRPLPHNPEGLTATLGDFQKHILPHATGNIHPRFWGWVQGSGTVGGAIAELLAGGMNCNTWGGDQVAIEVERQVLDWLKQAMGFPAESSGILVSGGSVSNLFGVTVARNAKAGFDLARHGVQGAPTQLVLYASSEAHSCFQKAAELVGLGNEALRKVPVDPDFRIRTDQLQRAIHDDREKGLRPFCIVGSAGTVNTGAVDDLSALADIAAQEDLWFHVDGAFGAFLALSPRLRDRLKGMERADSLAFSLHKWLHVQYDAGCVLVRHSQQHRDTFARASSYMKKGAGGLGGGDTWFSHYGFELSRGFRALKVWLTLKEHGLEKFGRLVEQNVDQAQHLAGLVQHSDDLELLAPAPLNIVCFRYRVAGLDDNQLSTLNQELLTRLHESGVAVPSSTVIDGKFAIRVCITNHRTRREDVALLVQEVRKQARALPLDGRSLVARH